MWKEKEDLIHFTVKCKKLERKRNYTIIDDRIDNYEERMKDLLYRNTDHIKTSYMIRNLWILRRDLLKERKEEMQQEESKKPQSVQSAGINTQQSGPPPSGLPQSRRPNPPPSGPPQSDLPQSGAINPP